MSEYARIHFSQKGGLLVRPTRYCLHTVQSIDRTGSTGYMTAYLAHLMDHMHDSNYSRFFLGRGKILQFSTGHYV